MSNARDYLKTGGDGMSGAGAARRDSMLSALQGAVVREGARRRARRAALRRSGSVCMVAVLGVSLFVGWPTSPSVDPVLTGVPQVESPIKIVRLASKPGALDRYAYAKPVDSAKYVVDDHALVAVLASIGRPSGLVHRGGRVMLTSFTPDPIRVPSPVDESGATVQAQ